MLEASREAKKRLYLDAQAKCRAVTDYCAVALASHVVVMWAEAGVRFDLSVACLRPGRPNPETGTCVRSKVYRKVPGNFTIL